MPAAEQFTHPDPVINTYNQALAGGIDLHRFTDEQGATVAITSTEVGAELSDDALFNAQFAHGAKDTKVTYAGVMSPEDIQLELMQALRSHDERRHS